MLNNYSVKSARQEAKKGGVLWKLVILHGVSHSYYYTKAPPHTIITYIDHFIIVHRPHPPGTHPQLLSMQENMLMLGPFS
jgi:hypothetical protein